MGAMSKPITENFHTHTYRCKHAEGDVSDYVEAALGAGLTTLGISDHTPLPDGWMESVRMSPVELDGYIRAIEEAARPGIRVLKSAECDINPRYFPYYEEELLGKKGCRYLIGALHWYDHGGEWIYAGVVPTPAHLKSYTDMLIRGMESKLFAFIAHPDHFAMTRLSWGPEEKACSRAILEAARDTGTILEINGNGFRKAQVEGERGPRPPYPWTPFWLLAGEYEVRVVCNSDAHKPGEITASIDLCRKLAEEAGLELGDIPIR